MKSNAYKIFMVLFISLAAIPSQAYCVFNNTSGHDTFNGQENNPTLIQATDPYSTFIVGNRGNLCNRLISAGSNDTTSVTIDWIKDLTTGSRIHICSVMVHNLAGNIIILGNATNGIPNFSCHVHRD